MGGLRAVTDRSWPRDGSNVWELVSGTSQHCYLKQHSSALFHQREVIAYHCWTAALGAGRVPVLVATNPHLRAIVVTAVPGQPLHNQQLPADTEAEIHRQAGTLLRRLHDASPGKPPGTSQAVTRADDQIQRSGSLIDCAQARLIRAHAARLDQIAPLIPAVPTHGDAQPRNFLWDAATRRLALIDFERAEPGPAVRDLVRLEYGPWDGVRGPAAVLVHGGGVTREEGGFYTRLAATLADAGLPSLRFDFRAHGASEGRGEDLTIAAVTNDVCAAVMHARAMTGSGPVDLIGASFGGGISAFFAAPPRPGTQACAIQPAAGLQEAVHRRQAVLGRRSDQRASRTGASCSRVPGALADLQAGRALLNEVFYLSPRQVLSELTVPVLLVHGTRHLRPGRVLQGGPPGRSAGPGRSRSTAPSTASPCTMTRNTRNHRRSSGRST
jgi:aminoglycoside phosphotransferase (APT) family kinase protein